MNVKVKIPTGLIDVITSSIELDWRLSSLKEKQIQKIIKRLVELWYFIYDKQITNSDVENLKFYVDVNVNDFRRFDIMVNSIRLTYKDLLFILNNAIECNGKYSSGNFSMGYRVKTDFLKFTKLTEFEIDFNKVFNKTKNKEYWVDKYPSLHNLIEDCYNASIDLDEYLFWMLNNVGMKLNPIYCKKTHRLKDRYLTEETIYYHFNLALKVNLKNIWFKLSNEGRLYSSISNLPKGAVNFIKLYGLDTSSIDISNCQPLILSTMVSNEDYKSDCMNGLFYDNMVQNLWGDLSLRSKFKTLSYKLIFFGSNGLKSGAVYECMEKLYKGLIHEINTIKEDRCLAKELQEKESNIFVKGIGKIKMFKLLRHDEVIVIKGNEEKVKEYLRMEFSKLKIKNLKFS